MSINHGEKTEVGGVFMTLIFYAFFWYVMFSLVDGSIWVWPFAVIAFLIWTGVLAHSLVRK